MNRIKNHPLLWTMLLLAVAALATEAWLLQRERLQARHAVAALQQKKQERDRLARQSPTLSEENERAIGRDLAGAEKMLVVWQAALQGQDTKLLAAQPPDKSIDVYFNIAAFVEKTRAMAVRAQVTFQPDERFGFATHASEGPGTELVPAVFRQRIVLQYLVETLIEARPLAVLAVQREHPLTLAQRTQRNHPAPAGTNGTEPDGHSGEPGDFFAFDKHVSLRVPGLVDSEAYRLEFTGQTRAVRAFLNNLASFRLPIVVRSVEAEPLSATASAGDPALPSASGAAVPLVADNLSRFTVVVELVEPVAASETPAS